MSTPLSLTEAVSMLNAGPTSLSEPPINTRPPTARQLEVLRFIHAYVSQHGSGPTLREIGRAIGVRSTNGVNDHLHMLERRNLITRRDMLTRGIRITSLGFLTLGVSEDEPSVQHVGQDELKTLQAENARLRRLLDLADQVVGELLIQIRLEVGR